MKKILLVLILSTLAHAVIVNHYNPYWQPSNMHVISNFDEGLSVWIKGTNDTLSVDTVHSHLKFSNSGLQFKTKTHANVVAKKYNCIIPDSLKWFYISFYVNDLTKLSGYQLQFAEDSAFTKYFNCALIQNIQTSCDGRIEFTIHKNQFGVTGGASWMNVKHVALVFTSAIDSIAQVTVSTLRMFNPSGKSNVVFMFDDGIKSQDTGFQILNSKGIKGTIFIIGGLLGQTLQGSYQLDTFVTLAQCKKFQDSGWDIGSHTYLHQYLDTTSDSAAEYEIKTNRDFLKSNGFNAYDIFAYPGGVYTNSTSTIVGKYHNFARTIFTNRYLSGSDTCFIGSPNQLLTPQFINPIGIGNENTVAQYLKEIDSCILKNTTAMIYLHHVQTRDNMVFNNFIPSDSLSKLADSVIARKNAGKCNIKSFCQMLNSYERYIP